jgi:aromatic-L-amino-acid decarboxylase
VVAARSLYLRHHPETRYEDLVIYTTSQTHSLGAKAGLVLGLSTRALDVTADDNYGLRGDTLRRAFLADQKAGKKPFILS